MARGSAEVKTTLGLMTNRPSPASLVLLAEPAALPPLAEPAALVV
jgi:hypothetical protein